MKKQFFFFLVFSCFSLILYSFCQKCEEIRKRNSELPVLYKYYEDFLQETGGVDSRFSEIEEHSDEYDIQENDLD